MHSGLIVKRFGASLANCIIALIGLLTGFFPIFSAQTDQENIDNHFIVLSYHDVQDELKTNAPSYTVKTSDFINQLSWLREHGYHAISLQQIVDAQAGKTSLPEKAVLLTFDDGYKSFYTKVFPILKLFNYPAVLALVGSWMEKDPKDHFTTGDESSSYSYQRQDLMSWDEVREVMASNLVEIASHSFNLHYGILANPQGNLQPAATSYQYLAHTSSYETDTEYLERIRLDLRKNSDLLRQRTGIQTPS